MCAPRAPKPPPQTQGSAQPRILLSRRQFDDLMISDRPGFIQPPTRGPMGNDVSSPGGTTSAGLFIAR